jgi:hypothetical protein
MHKPNSSTKGLTANFNLLWFIMSLGLGGTGVAGFAFLNYTIARTPDHKGLVHVELLSELLPRMSMGYNMLANYLTVHILVFGALHLLTLATALVMYNRWRKQHPEKYEAIAQTVSKAPLTVTPAVALGMSFNVMLVMGYFFVPWIRANMQEIMPVALAFWGGLWVYTMGHALRVQSLALREGCSAQHGLHFGWLLVPFALAMNAVGGAGIAALGTDPIVTKTAFFLSLITFSMAAILFLLKLFALFRHQYQIGQNKTVESMPTFFMVVPIITLLSITLFRYGHFAHNQLDAHMDKGYYALVTAGGWATMTWYLLLGLVLLKEYFTKHFFNFRYFDESQWGLVCPVVAYSVLGAFVYKTLLPSPLLLWFLASLIFLDVFIIASIGLRQVAKWSELAGWKLPLPKVGLAH